MWGEFGRNLEGILEERDITAYRLAEMIGSTSAQMTRYLRYGRIPKLDTACKIANALNITLDELAGGLRREVQYDNY